MRTKEKAYAKLNLALKVGDKKDGFHELDGIAVTVDLYDTVIVETRRDDKIVLKPEGLREYVYNCTPTLDNAYKTAQAFFVFDFIQQTAYLDGNDGRQSDK